MTAPNPAQPETTAECRNRTMEQIMSTTQQGTGPQSPSQQQGAATPAPQQGGTKSAPKPVIRDWAAF